MDKDLQIAIDRLADYEKGKATSSFFCGRAVDGKDKKKKVRFEFGLYHKCIELDIVDIKTEKTLYQFKVSGKKFKGFVKKIKEWIELMQKFWEGWETK
jgi:hypothetical protein